MNKETKSGVVSVVIPVYNVEKYLDRCITSVINQTYKNLEIILVDDGSPDTCPQMCDEWEKRDARIKVVHKQNAGLGFARNTGIENASGEYICFFDSDDYIAVDTIKTLYENAKSNDADTVCFGYNRLSKTGKLEKTCIPQPLKYVYEGNEVRDFFLPDLISTDTGNFTNLWMSVCGTFFSMDLIHRSKWRLVSEREIISEDVYSLLRLYKYVKKVVIVPRAFYFYCTNETSLTNTYKVDRFERLKKFYDACIDACDELDYNNDARKRLGWPLISNTIGAMKMVTAAELDEKVKIEEIKRIVCDQELQKVVHSLSAKNRKCSKRFFVFLIKNRMWMCCYFLLKIKVSSEKKVSGNRRD